MSSSEPQIPSLAVTLSPELQTVLNLNISMWCSISSLNSTLQKPKSWSCSKRAPAFVSSDLIIGIPILPVTQARNLWVTLNPSHFYTPTSRCLINSVGSTFEISLKSRLFSTLCPILLLLEFDSFVLLALTTTGASHIGFLRKPFPHPVPSTLCHWS